MSVFGYDTLEELILGYCDERLYTKEQIIKALLKVTCWINHRIDDGPTIIKI